MAKIVDYLLVTSESREELIMLIQENIKDWGWQPIGSICISCNTENFEGTYSDYNTKYAQAMVKYEEEK